MWFYWKLKLILNGRSLKNNMCQKIWLKLLSEKFAKRKKNINFVYLLDECKCIREKVYDVGENFNTKIGKLYFKELFFCFRKNSIQESDVNLNS